MFNEIFNYVGEYGPLFLIFFSWFLLWNNSKLFMYYTIGIFLDNILNLILKGLFQLPRPNEDIKNFNLALLHGKRFIFKNGIPYDMFGMPSGHAQSSFYTLTFIFFALYPTKILYLYFILSFITLFQRFYFKHHSILQLIIGAIIGIFTGYFMFFFASQSIKGKITEKIDDFAPI